MKLKQALSRLLALSIILTTLPTTPAHIAIGQDNKEAANDISEEGLRFRLSEGSVKTERPKPAPLAPARPLPERDTQTLLGRLPAIKPEAGDAQDFKFRERSLPPPRAGETIQAAFAPPATDAPPALPKTTAPLELLRYAPEGEVALAPALSLTFSQPMIDIASQEEAAARIPVTLTPQPEGRWRWLDTQTLIFQPEMEGGRMPMATYYTVTIPAGTKSALGNALRKAAAFTFATPPPTLQRSYPGTDSTGAEGQPRDALVFLEFDQRINAARVLEGIKFQPAVKGLRLRLASTEEIAADKSIKELVKESPAGRWLVFRAVDLNGATKDALPPDTDIKIVIPPGTPSAEGPRTTLTEQNISFKTFGALRVTEAGCDGYKHCSPFDQFRITFSNQIDLETIPASKVAITPPIEDVQLSGYGNSLNIQGTKRSNTTYTITLDRSLKDKFGQTLAGDNQLTFKVTTADPRLFATSEALTVLDPAVRRTFNIYSVNYHQVKVRLYKVTPDDWQKFRFYQVARRYQKEHAAGPPPGRLVLDKVIDLKGETDQLIETFIDLSPALTNGYGQVFVQVEPVEEKNAPVRVYASRPDGRIEAWVQATDIGLDAFVDKGGLLAWANSLQDGRPLAGVEIKVVPDNLTSATGANGLARLAFKAATKTDKQTQEALLVARRGDDVAILPQTSHPSYDNDKQGSNWRPADLSESLSWYVFDDRKLYRPGEEVNIKGWIRKVNLTPTGDTELFATAGETVNYILKDTEGNELTKGSVKLNALAGFNLILQLPPTMNLGRASLE
ncbi:MAG: alpha-2-macroglobulin, partial [Blastocatellia bacterium]|nr:alpha-2-macroglobulin [Blastocatellia bacterium]